MSILSYVKDLIRPAWRWLRRRLFSWRPGCVDSIGQIGDSLLVLDGWSCADAATGPIEIRFGVGQWAPAVAVRFERADVVRFPGGRGLMVLTKLPAGGLAALAGVTVRVRGAGQRAEQWPLHGHPVATDLADRLRSRITVDRSFATAFTEAAANVPATLGSDAASAVGRIDSNVASDRTVIPPPVAPVDGAKGIGIAIDYAFRLDHGLMIAGWARANEPAATIRLKSSGTGGQPATHTIRFERSDIDKMFGDPGGTRSGFIAWFETTGTAGSSAAVELATGRQSLAVSGPKAVRADLASARTTFVDLVPVSLFRDVETAESVLHPFLGAMSEQASRLPFECRVQDIGSPPASPRLSVIIPVYRQLGLMEHQVVQFARDSGLHNAEILFALDSPEQAEEFLSTAHTLHAIYGLDFRVGIMDANAGYAGANNAAVRACRGTRLCLLNSDVIPDRPGWLDALDAALTEHGPEVAAVGPKLLYEDDSIQHAGMFFRRTDTGIWFNDHFYKGFHRRFPAANTSRCVPGVTGACLVIDRDRYEAIGGFTETYVLGDCEDSDFCLKLHAEGYRVRYEADVELYHLEGQSYPSHRRQKLVYYNHWLQTKTWGTDIDALMAEVDA